MEKAKERSRWFSRSLHQNPKAAIPLYLAGLGSLCWETAALWNNPKVDFQTTFWMALVDVGLVSMPLGLIGSIVYRHYKAAGVAIIIALISPPVWFWLLFACYKIFGPIFGPEEFHGFPVALWLLFQLPLVLIALWRSRGQMRVKAIGTALAAAGLFCVFLLNTAEGQREIDMAPHVSDEYLSSVYEKNDTSAIKRLQHKKIVVTGAVFGADDGLIGGGGPYRMQGSIECDNLVGNDSLTDGQIVSIIGTCEGRDSYGELHLSDCLVIKRPEK